MLELIKGYKIKGLAALWIVLCAMEKWMGLDVLNSVTPDNALDNIFVGMGVFAGRDTVDTIIAKLSGEFNPKA